MPAKVNITPKTKIYILRHPVTSEIRYVGKTVRPLSLRLSNHISEAKNRPGNRRYVLSWIKGLLPLSPAIELICEVDGDGCAQEKAYIKFYRENGFRLTNLTDGGEGTTGYRTVCTAEHRAKISASKMGHEVTAETKAKLSAALIGRTLSPERRVQIAVGLIGNKYSVGRKHSAETRAKMSAAHMGHTHNRGRKLTPEHKAKLSAAHKGNQHFLGRNLSPEHKTNISIGSKGHRKSDETRSKMSAAAKIREAQKRLKMQRPTLVDEYGAPLR